MQYNFWKKKFDLELIYLKNKDESNKESLYKNIICNMINEMIDLKVIKAAIKSIIKKLSNEIFGKDSETSKEIFNVFKEQIVKAKYISKIKE